MLKGRKCCGNNATFTKVDGLITFSITVLRPVSFTTCFDFARKWQGFTHYLKHI